MRDHVEHPTPNTQHPTPNTQHPTPNTQHPTPNTQQIKCYVINLDRSKDRLEYITQAFNERGLELERVAAVDGALLSDEEFERHTENLIFPRKLVKAEIGCFLSHRECWRRVIDSDNKWAAVFEDDIILSSNIKKLLSDIS